MSNKYFVKKQCCCGVEEGRNKREVKVCYDKLTKKSSMVKLASDAWRYEDMDNGLLVRGCCIRCWTPEEENKIHWDEQRWGDGRETKGLAPLWDDCGCGCEKGGLAECDRSTFAGFYYTQRRIARCPKYLYPQFKMETAHKQNMAEIEKSASYKGMEWAGRRTGQKLIQHIIHNYRFVSKSEKLNKWGDALMKNKRIIVANKGHHYTMHLLKNQTAEELAVGGDVLFKARYSDTYFNLWIKDAIKWVEFGALYDVAIEKDTMGTTSLCDDVLSLIRSYVV